MKVLVTDGHLKAALSVARAFGRLGVEVHTTQSRSGSTLCSLSAFTRRAHVLAAPESGPGFDAQLLDLLQRERFDYLLAASEPTLQRIALNRDRIGELTRVDLPPQESLNLVLSKVGLLEFARNAHVPIPRTVTYSRSMTAQDILRVLDFPIVAKTFWGDIYDRVKYINNLQELTSYLADSSPAQTISFQEYVRGIGCGFFSFFERGKALLCQMYERIWEYPITGGPSVFAGTVDEPVLRDLGRRLLEQLHWHGLAMVEFKKRGRDDYVLLEINPRPWGSLDLSLASGANFLRLALETDRPTAARSYVVNGTSFLWLLPDSLLYLLARPTQAFRFLRLLFAPRVKKNLWLDDIRPVLRQLREALYWVRILSRHRRLRYPHGRPLA